MLHASNLSFALCPMLTDGAIEALLTAASPDLRQKYVPKLISGEWTGTMNLTEPQAGSDLAAVRTRAEPQVGDHGGAIGELVGEVNRGLEYMFIMMNAARFAVGMQGISVSDRAYQQAVSFANDRLQSRDLAGSAGPVAIINHPDVKRMLLTMRAYTEGARVLAYVAAAASDAAHHAPDEAVRRQNQAVYDYLVPVVKGFSTEMSIDVASLGVQVHGGMGFIEETGAAQHYRARRCATAARWPRRCARKSPLPNRICPRTARKNAP